MKYIEDHWNTSIVFEASIIPNTCDVFMKDFVQNCSDFEICYGFSENIDCDNETTFLAVSSSCSIPKNGLYHSLHSDMNE